MNADYSSSLAVFLISEVIRQHRHQPLVIGAVVQRRQAQAVLRVEAIVGVVAPRDDVAGDHQLVMAQATDATGGVVAGQHRLAKARLVHAHLHKGSRPSAPLRYNGQSRIIKTPCQGLDASDQPRLLR